MKQLEADKTGGNLQSEVESNCVHLLEYCPENTIHVLGVLLKPPVIKNTHRLFPFLVQSVGFFYYLYNYMKTSKGLTQMINDYSQFIFRFV